MKRKGIILAGGSGTRLYPATLAVNKQLLPVYDKPMIYYPLSILMLTGIRDILLISTPEDQPRYKLLLGDGSAWGINLSYAIQETPAGLPQAYTIAEDFLAGAPSAMILGDNIIYGAFLEPFLKQAMETGKGGTVFTYGVKDADRFGVMYFNEDGTPAEVVEKPKNPQSNHAVIGLYFFDERAPQIAKGLKPSARGEFEITDMIRFYLQEKTLGVIPLGRGYTWIDTGLHESLLEASEFIAMVEKRQRHKIGCPEEISWRKGWLTDDQMLKIARGPLAKSGYGEYLESLVMSGRSPNIL